MSERCQNFRDLLVAASLHELDSTQLEELDRHLHGCVDCREFRDLMVADDRDLDAFIAASGSRLAALEERIISGLPAEQDRPPLRLIRPVYLRWAAAAAVLVAVILGLDMVNRDSGPGVVWADVMAKVAEAEDFICRRIEKADGEPALEMVEYRSAEFGLRQEIYEKGRHQATQIINPETKTLYALIHRDRTYMRQGMTAEQIESLSEQSNARSIVSSFREHEYESLGRKKIDGRMAEGIEIVDPPEWRAVFESGVWRLWVDLETQWPVKIELEGTSREGRFHKTYTLKDFQWNPALAAEDFAVEIPDDYRLIADIKAVEATEKQALAAIKDYARLVGGRYPSKLALSTAIAEATEILDERHDGYDKAAGKDLESLFTIRNACEFFQNLESEDKEPAWYGDEVRPTDFDLVLMHWRLDDGRYRVIYGDLRSETVESIPKLPLMNR